MEPIDLRYVITPHVAAAIENAFRQPFSSATPATEIPAYAAAIAPAWVDPIVDALTIAGHAAAYDVLFERARQQEQERFDQAHDDAHSTGGLARAAACYLAPPDWAIGFPDGYAGQSPPLWPWEDRWWKPGGDDAESYRRRLVKGAALAIAEIERVDRLAASKAIG